jgi:hypothetical protein
MITLHLIAIPTAIPQHQIVQMMTQDSVAVVHSINIGTAQVVISLALHDLPALMDVGLIAERPIQAANNMIYFYKRG